MGILDLPTRKNRELWGWKEQREDCSFFSYITLEGTVKRLWSEQLAGGVWQCGSCVLITEAEKQGETSSWRKKVKFWKKYNHSSLWQFSLSTFFTVPSVWLGNTIVTGIPKIKLFSLVPFILERSCNTTVNCCGKATVCSCISSAEFFIFFLKKYYIGEVCFNPC